MPRPKLTAAEKEARSEARFKQNRAVRDMVLRARAAAAFDALDRSARIVTSYAARKAVMADLVVTDQAKRRRARIKQRRELMRQYRDWMALCPASLKAYRQLAEQVDATR